VDESTGFAEPLREEDLPPSETFGTRLSRRDGVVWLALGGELDVFTAPHLRAALREAHVRKDDALVLDLRGLNFVDSSGLAVILGVHERTARESETPVRIIIRGSAPVEALFETIGAADYLNLIEDPSDLERVRS
jgi:anti-anti-sigma factor